MIDGIGQIQVCGVHDSPYFSIESWIILRLVGQRRRNDHHHDNHLGDPLGLSDTKRAAAHEHRRHEPGPHLVQQLLDELAGRMQAGAIRLTPLAYLQGLVARAGDGTKPSCARPRPLA